MLKPAIRVALLLRIIFAFEVFAHRARDRRLDDDDARGEAYNWETALLRTARRGRLRVADPGRSRSSPPAIVMLDLPHAAGADRHDERAAF